MAGSDPLEDDEFPPRRPFGVPARPAPAEPDEGDDGAMARAAGRAGSAASRRQPPATPA